MKKNRLTLSLGFALLVALPVVSQNIAINADGSLPDSSAILDIKSYNKGLLIPRTGTAARLAMPNTRGLLVYDTATASFWYNTGAAWQNMYAAGTWSLTGNSIDSSLGYFLGTTNYSPLKIRVNNNPSGFIDPRTDNTYWGYSTRNVSGPSQDTGNTGIGAYALRYNIDGGGNTAIGVIALARNTRGSYNTAVGAQSLGNNYLGWWNTASGYYALGADSAGQFNTANGAEALQITGGNYNSAFGFQSMYTIRSGNYNTAIGSLADFSVSGLSNATAIGYGAIADASNKVRIGNSAVTVIEGQVPFTTPSDGRFKYAVQEDVKGLDFILKLRPVTYRFDAGRFDAQHGNPQEAKSGAHTNYALQVAYNEASLIRRSGFIAQEVEKAARASGYDFSGIITPKTEQEHYSLSYESFVVPLVKAVQEQQKTIDEQNKTIAELKQQLGEIKQLLQPTK